LQVYRVLLNGCEPHAAKVFRLGADPQAQLHFLEEASTLRLLRHTHVVGFAGVCVAAGSGIILMVRLCMVPAYTGALGAAPTLHLSISAPLFDRYLMWLLAGL
jgi:hypothetical protein